MQVLLDADGIRGREPTVELIAEQLHDVSAVQCHDISHLHRPPSLVPAARDLLQAGLFSFEAPERIEKLLPGRVGKRLLTERAGERPRGAYLLEVGHAPGAAVEVLLEHDEVVRLHDARQVVADDLDDLLASQLDDVADAHKAPSL
jgi:hypothetical protein